VSTAADAESDEEAASLAAGIESVTGIESAAEMESVARTESEAGLESAVGVGGAAADPNDDDDSAETGRYACEALCAAVDDDALPNDLRSLNTRNREPEI
jgi:hypothetical protein